MTTLVHEAFVELFRVDGWLLKEMIGERYRLQELCPVPVNTELTQLPSQYRADGITVFCDAKGKARFAVVIEVQRTKKRAKRYAWPVYVSATRATHKCPTLLLVVAVDEKIARWARASIKLGHPGFQLEPLVITKDQIPHINDIDSAQRMPRLAVLSALTHHSIEIAAAALSVIDRVSPDYVEVYRDLILSKFSEAEQTQLEANMEQYYEWQSVRAKKQIAELQAESKREGMNAGLQEGRIFAHQNIVIRLVKEKLGHLWPEQAAKIRKIEDEEKLYNLIITLSRSTSLEPVHALLG